MKRLKKQSESDAECAGGKMEKSSVKTVFPILDVIGEHELPDPDILEFYKGISNREIVLNSIVDDGCTAFSKMIIDWNREDFGKSEESRTPIKLYINSLGGDVETCFALIDVIEASKTPVYTIGIGKCYSAAGLILMSGKKRFIFKNTKLLIHDGIASVESSTSKFIDTAELIRKNEDLTNEYITNHSKISKDVIEKNYRRDWFLDANEMVEYGCADKIITTIDEVL